MRIGLIGGTGVGAWGGARTETVATRDGPVTVEIDGDSEVVFIDRHRGGVPAHDVRHRAHFDAFRALDVDAVLALNNTGGLDPALPPGALVVPDDLFDRSTRGSFIDEGIVHVGMDPPFCPELRHALGAAFGDWSEGLQDHGTYVQSPGPRLETRAEARFLAGVGDIVGMTAGPEAIMAREAGICFAPVCFVANHAPGIGDRVLTAPEIRDALARSRRPLAEGMMAALRAVPETRHCRCRQAAGEGCIS